MKKSLLGIILTLLCSVTDLKAQISDDHLEPVSGIFDIYNFQFEYYSKVRTLLFNDLTITPEIRFLVMPSFSPENVLVIEFDRNSEKYFIVHRICEEMVWYNNRWADMKVEEFKSEINKESVDIIKSLFSSAIAQVKYPEKDIIGSDGVNYYFTANSKGLKSGMVWSPAKGTKMDKLVTIGLKLTELAKSKSRILEIDEKLRKEIENLIIEFKQTTK